MANGDMQGVAGSYNNIGMTYDYLGEAAGEKDPSGRIQFYDMALKNYFESLKICEELGDKRGISTACSNIGELYIILKQYDQASELLNKALIVSIEIRNYSITKASYKALSRLNELMGNWKGAYENFIRFTDVKDSLFNIESQRNITEMQTKYETEKKEKENVLLNKENEIKNLEIKKEKTQKYALVASVFLILVISILIYNRVKLKQQKLLSEEMLKQEKFRTKSMLQAQDEERKRIAGELHDGIGQMLSAVKLNVSSLDEKNNEQYKNAISLIDESCNELRNISHNLMPGLLVNTGLIPALNDLADKLKSSSLKIFVESAGFEKRPHSEVEIHLFRIVQELLNNIIKHSGATEVYIQINQSEKDFTLMVEDNGNGFDKNNLKTSKGNGWNNINSRLEILNAKIEIDSHEGKGTVVFVQLPLMKIYG